MIGAKSKPSVKVGRQKDQGSVALLGNISFPMTKEFVPTQHFGRIRLVQNTGAVGPSQASVEQHYLCKVLPVLFCVEQCSTQKRDRCRTKGLKWKGWIGLDISGRDYAKSTFRANN